jgi:hypothetical protein
LEAVGYNFNGLHGLISQKMELFGYTHAYKFYVKQFPLVQIPYDTGLLVTARTAFRARGNVNVPNRVSLPAFQSRVYYSA